ncbi:Uncharacterized protein DBV15_02738 [Temnothorax longispinosus]|uniref:FERM, RhoGEF and pleckstrin domain-containing protein 1 n=1 Tax=Temnothorax longispinosus TaxID=300112 RepID=A0A4V3S9P0_9HYME|nr:Uncharacterized protein DBV15_02738 [Temnothorax longispinosus]
MKIGGGDYNRWTYTNGYVNSPAWHMHYRVNQVHVQAEKQAISNQRENNNSVYAAEKSPDKRTTNGGVEMNNASVVNSPDLSPIKNVRNGEAEEAEVRKTKWFREEVSREAALEGESVVSLVELLADVHGPCLQEMEARLARWESNARHNIGDFLYNTLLNVLPLYDQYLENLIPVLEKMEYSMRTSRRFDQLCRDFESQKHCYLPLTSFLLKPLQRLLHYNSIIDRLLDHYPKDHTDFEDCLAARDRLGETLLEGLTIINQAENLVQLCEMQRDITGFDNLVQEGRRFIRLGCLQKYSRKGFQQRMFFLFSDVLLYTFRTQQPTQCFRVHGQLPLKGMKIQDADNKTGTDFAFIVDGQGNQSLTVAASNEEEKERWIEDLNMAITQIDADAKMPYLSLKSCILGSADEMGDSCLLYTSRCV